MEVLLLVLKIYVGKYPYFWKNSMFLIMYFMYILNILGNIDCMVEIIVFIQYNRKYMKKKKNRKIDKFLSYPSTLLNEQIEGYY